MFTTLSILLAEDDEDDALITKGVLDEIQDMRLHFDWASTYEAAAERICDKQHDVYIFDYSLGAHSGLDLLAVTREHCCAAPVIMLTGHADNQSILRAIRAGATDYLVKGQYDAQVLGRSIRYSLDRKRAESALRVSEERYRKLIENASEMVFSYDWQGQLTAANSSMERITGYSREELTMMNLALLLTEESRATMDEMNTRQMAGECPEPCEVAIQSKCGAVIAAEMRSALIADGHRPVEFQAIARTK